MDELEEIRRRRLAELQAQKEANAASQEPSEDESAAREEAAFEQLSQQLLETEARERIARIRLSRPEFAAQVMQQLMMLAQRGRLQKKLSDEELKAILTQLNPKDRDIQIKRR